MHYLSRRDSGLPVPTMGGDRIMCNVLAMNFRLYPLDTSEYQKLPSENWLYGEVFKSSDLGASIELKFINFYEYKKYRR